LQRFVTSFPCLCELLELIYYS
jgi:molecular chaperone DnaK (HSP70)